MPSFTLPTHYVPNTDALKNRVVLITGAGGGLGKPLSIKLAALGATVILLGKTIKKLEVVYDEIETSGYPLAAIYPLDLSGASTEHYQQMAASISAEFGRLDGIVHCAANLGTMTPLSHYSAGDWQKTVQVNLTGPMFLTQACLPLLTQADTASVIFTVDRKPHAYWGAYGICKAGIESAVCILADEVESRKNVAGERILSVNAVVPGPMQTHIRRTAFPGENAQSIPPADNYLSSYVYLLDPTIDKPNGQVIDATQCN